MATDFSAAINEIMPLVQDGDKSKPFLITRDNAYGDWQVCYPDNDKADGFTVSQRQHDPYIAKYYGADFDGGSYPFVHDKILCDRLRAEYNAIPYGVLHGGELNALINVVEDNIGSFSQSVIDYLLTFENPLRELYDINPIPLWNRDGENNEPYIEENVMEFIEAIEYKIGELTKEAEPPVIDNRTMTRDSPNMNLWLRLGVTLDVPESQGLKILSGNEQALLDVLTDPCKEKGEWYIDGETYIPDEIIDELPYDRDIYGHIEFELPKTAMSEHIQNKTAKQSKERPPVTLTAEHCIKNSNDKDFTGQVLIVKADALMPKYRDSESQIVKCTHGNGARPNAMGRSIFCKELASDNTAVYYREEIEGIANIAKLPVWAKQKLSPPEKQQEKTEPTQSSQSKQQPSLLGEVREAARLVEQRKAERGNAPSTKNKDGLEV